MRPLLCAAFAAIIPTSIPTPARALDQFPSPAGWPAFNASRSVQEQTGPGVSYEHWVLGGAGGPLSISILTVDLTNPFVALTAAAQNGVIQGPGARLSAIGDSVHAQAGVNGDYFDIGATGTPLNSLVVDGQVLHRPSGAAVFYVGADKQPHLGPMTWHATVTPLNSAPLSISGLNDWSAATPLALLTRELGNSNAYGATEAVLQPASGTGAFSVVSVAENLTALATLAPGQIGIAGHGDAASSIAAEFAQGASVSVDYEGDPPPASIATAIGGGPLLIRGGAPYDDPVTPAPQETNVRYPLTGAGLSADGRTLWLVVVDGRRPSVSVGITRPMFGALFAALGASDAMAFDSGGSSEMVVRHLGDPGVSVVTTPSDGRERAVADGLFVLNSAPVGPASQILLRAAAPAVLVGSKLTVRAEAVDGNLQPVALPEASLSWRIDPNGALTSDDSGNLQAQQPGDATITVTSGAISTSSTVSVVQSIAGLTISGSPVEVPLGTTVQLAAIATDKLGRAVAIDANAVTWSASHGSSITPSGALTAGAAPAAVTVQAAAGGVRATALVNVGDHRTVLQRVMSIGADAGAWHFSGSSQTVDGTLEVGASPDGSPGARLTFQFPPGVGTRAAYAVGEIAVANSPIAIACDVYGDGGGEWVRASYKNADGIVDSITLARHVDWMGWRTVRAPVLPQVRWPIVITRLYVAQPDKRAAHGELWLRNLAAVYPGP